MAVERRSTHPVDQLTRQLDAVCTRAQDAHEIAAFLEAEGLSDGTVRERYRYPDVFSLASAMHARVPLRIRDADVEEEPRLAVPPAPVLMMRGLIYLIPALFFMAAQGLVDQGNMLVAVLPALLLAWVWNQGWGALTHRLIGSADLPGACRLSRQSLAIGTVLLGAVALLTTTLALGDPLLGLIGVGQGVAFIASGALLTLGRDGLVVLAYAPGIAVMVVSLVSGGLPAEVIGGAAAATVAALVGALLWATRRSGNERFSRLGRDEASLAGAHALLGLSWALLIALGGLAIAGAPNLLTRVSLAAAPLVLTMGVAEWRLHRFRRRIRLALARTSDPGWFARLAREAFARGLATYSAFIAGLTAASVALSHWIGLAEPSQIILSVGFAFLGCGLFAGLALVTMDRIRLPLTASGWALLATLGLISLGRAGVGRGPFADLGGAIAFLAGCLALCLGLGRFALRAVAGVVVHR